MIVILASNAMFLGRKTGGAIPLFCKLLVIKVSLFLNEECVDRVSLEAFILSYRNKKTKSPTKHQMKGERKVSSEQHLGKADFVNNRSSNIVGL